MPSGTIKWFNAQKGYGFIKPDDGGADVFLHISEIEKAGLDGVHEGQKFAYEFVTDSRTGKTKAGNLKVM